jgi:hypothetical protein
MAYPETRILEELGSSLLASARIPPEEAEQGRRRSLQALEANLNRLRAGLSRAEVMSETDRIRDLLAELAVEIQLASSLLQSSDYRWILERLTRIYARGLRRQTWKPFAFTAAAYAQVVETISRAYPSQDYSEAVGQLFCYMSRLFRTREHGWKAVYERILSIPDSVEAKQLLYRAFFVEIQEWAEAGVENLFEIRSDLYQRIAEIGAEIERLDCRIAAISDPSSNRDPGATAVRESNVLDLAQARGRRQITSLSQRRRELIDDKDDEESILALIESDILEFEEKLWNTRRAFFVRAV